MSGVGKHIPLKKKLRVRKVDDRITCIFLPKPNGQWSNVYLIEDEELALIDTGRPEAFSVSALKGSLAHLGYGVEDITSLIYTHAHIDHVGGGVALGDRFRCKNIAYYETMDSLKDFSRFMEEWTKEFMSILPNRPTAQEIPKGSPTSQLLTLPKFKNGITIHRGVKDGDVIDLGKTKLRVYHTPGHSPWDISLYEAEKRLLFTGDLITSPATVLVSTMGSDLTDYLRSLNRIDQISINRMLPGHGRFSRNPYRLIEEARGYIRMWERLIIDQLLDGPRTLHGITSALLDGYDDLCTQIFNYGMIDTFLTRLQEQGSIVSYGDNGKRYYKNGLIARPKGVESANH